MAHEDAATPPHSDRGSLAGFFRSRWRGDAPLGTLFWRDMLLVGSGINLASLGIVLIMLGTGLPGPAAVSVHFATLPYNFFLFLAVWRTSGRIGGWTAQLAPLGAAAWLAIATVV